MTVREMLSRMDSYELAEWKVLYGMDPWGELRDDHRSALQTAHLINIQRDHKRHPSPVPVKNFLLTFAEPEETPPVTVSEKTKSFVSDLQARLAMAQTKRQLRGVA